MMFRAFLFLQALAISSISVALHTSNLYSQEKIALGLSYSYFCSEVDGIARTIVRTPTWGDIPIIHWTAIQNSTNQSPQERCQETSANLERAYSNGTLKYIRSATDNGQPIICVAAYKGGSCLPSGSLLVLNEGTNPDTALAHLVDLPTIRAGNPLYQNGGLLLYHDGEAYVNLENLIDAILGIQG